MMSERCSISVVLPVYNEEGNIGKVIGETTNFLQSQDMFKEYEIIAVDDGSRDNTAAILRKLRTEIPCLRIITHCKNVGYGKALMSGVKNARHHLIFFMDADGQFDISEMKKMFCSLGDFDIIAGYRYKREDAFYRTILANIYSWLVSLLFGLKLKDVNCGFKLFKREVLEAENISCGAGVFYTELLIGAKDRGFTVKEFPVEHFPRLKGKQTGASSRVICNAIIDLVRLKYFLVKKQKRDKKTPSGLERK